MALIKVPKVWKAHLLGRFFQEFPSLAETGACCKDSVLSQQGDVEFREGKYSMR
jgi:hypothetical protein